MLTTEECLDMNGLMRIDARSFELSW